MSVNLSHLKHVVGFDLIINANLTDVGVDEAIRM